MTFIPAPQEIYKHFKGNLYQVITIAEHSETGEQLVVYQAMYGDFKTYARPLTMFTGLVDKSRYPDAGQEYRFELQGPGRERQRGDTQDEYDAQEKPAGRQAAEAPRQRGEQGMAAEASKERGEQGSAAEASKERGEQGTAVEAPGEQGKHASSAETSGEPEEWKPDPLLLEFLDADSYEERLNILAGLHHRLTDEMLTTMAIACDLEVGEGSLEERYEGLRNCLRTLDKYECSRLR